MTEIDPATAKALGWPKAKYAWVELERRWLCDRVPEELIVDSETIVDLYVTDTALRLREALPVGGGEPMRRLGRKADVNPSTRLLTSIYLAPNEYKLLSVLPGRTLCKTRHRLGKLAGAEMVCVDIFEGPLAGLIIAEAEFDTVEAMEAYSAPAFAGREVTDDVRYTGGHLAGHGLPV
jgi:hypothetical protein